jgi:hypothetical protein
VLPEFEVCPTLDLRIDYMHAAEPNKDVYGFAQCYRVTTDVIFTRGFAYQDDPSNPLPTWWAPSCAWARASRAQKALAAGSRRAMSDDWKQQLLQAHARATTRLAALIPYAGLIGIECSRVGDDLLFRCRPTRTTLVTLYCRRSMAGSSPVHGAVRRVAPADLHRSAGAEDHRFSSTTCAPGSFATPGPSARCGARAGACQRGHYRLAKHRSEPIATARAHFKIDEPLKS